MVQALADVIPVLDDVKRNGLPALLRHALRLGDITSANAKVCFDLNCIEIIISFITRN